MTDLAVTRMREAALALLAALDQPQRTAAHSAFDTADHREWTYLPGPRPGLALSEMTEQQRELALRLLDTGLSAAGAATARDVMALDDVLRDLEREDGRAGWQRRHRHHYWVRVLGDPATDQTWAWRVGGHHLAVHLTVVAGRVAGTPQFFGANPAVVPRGPRAGRRTLPAEERDARALMDSLQPPQRYAAHVAAAAPRDIATRDDPVADPATVPRGVGYADLAPHQQRRLENLVRLYLGRMIRSVAEPAEEAVTRAGWHRVSFSWAGGVAPGEGHYYAVRGPTFLLEYDNVSNGANHIHTVWRDIHRDWGSDLLAEHRAAHH